MFLRKQNGGDNLKDNILELYEELYKKKKVLSKLISKVPLHGHGYSEVHCIYLIGKMDFPNVTKIAEQLKMTRGAISKITKKQIEDGLISTYTTPNNKKEIYFRLTEKGQQLFDEHELRRIECKERDMKFLECYPNEKLNIIEEFLTEFNSYLKERIEELS